MQGSENKNLHAGGHFVLKMPPRRCNFGRAKGCIDVDTSVMIKRERERGFYMLQPDNKSDRMCHGQMPMTIPNETSSMCVYLIVLHAQSPKQTSNLNQIVNQNNDCHHQACNTLLLHPPERGV